MKRLHLLFFKQISEILARNTDITARCHYLEMPSWIFKSIYNEYLISSLYT